jgi:2-polyprenyl-3-methyl-5-hydroxy-6-metoxy-1,4-benzoquinol methylase
MEIQNTPVLGGTAPRHATRTAQKLANFALGWLDSIPCNSQRRRYLDVGCGNGFITERVAPSFDEVVGIDMEEERLADFRAHVNGKPNFQIWLMSVARIEFPSEFFPFITAFEVLEHVPDLDTSVREMVRVCRQGGVIVVSVPQVWFPFENHGAQIGDKVYARKIPFLPYIRPLHRKWSLARVFSSAEMDRLFIPKGMELLGTSYVSPQFERAAAQANSWESKFAFLKHMLDRCESIPGLRALTGVSMLKAYRKSR